MSVKDKSLQFLAYFFIGGLCLVSLCLFYLFYIANFESKEDKVLSKVKALSQKKIVGKRSNQAYKKIDKNVLEERKKFIQDVLIKGLPGLKKAYHECRNNLTLELQLRGLNLENLDISSKESKKIFLILHRHIDKFRYESDRSLRKIKEYYFKDKTSNALPITLYYEALNQAIESSVCTPSEVLEKLSSSSTLLQQRQLLAIYKKKHRKYFGFLPYLSKSNFPSHYYPMLIKTQIKDIHQETLDENIHVLKRETSNFHIDLYSGIDETNHKLMISQYNDLKKKVSELEDQLDQDRREREKIERLKKEKEEKKNEIKIAKKDKKSQLDDIRDQINKLPRDKKERIYKNIKLFSQNIFKSQKVLDKEILNYEPDSDPYKNIKASSEFKRALKEVKFDIVKLFKVNKKETASEVDGYLLGFIDNLHKVDETFFKLNKKKKKTLSLEEKKALEAYLKAMEDLDS